MEIPGYEIKQSIGSGGMATAYLAIQTSLGRQVVIKALDTQDKSSADMVERFLNEGRIIASFNHPHIVTIYDIGIAEDAVYISMEYVEGGDLKQRMRKHLSTGPEAVKLVQDIASGLQVAHENGIVHRDVKPGNILFRRDGTPLLSDFGIAKQLTTDHDLTSTGIFLGSPNYMAPEQAEGGPIDGRADLYALGVIFYELLTGEKPYKAASVIDIIVAHKQAPIPKLPDKYSDYQEFLELLLAKKRRDRFRDAKSLIYFAEHLTLSPSAPLPQPDVGERTDEANIPTVQARIELDDETTLGKPKRRPKRIPAVLMVLLVLATVGFVGVHYLASQMNEEPRRDLTSLPLQGMPVLSVPETGGNTATPAQSAILAGVTKAPARDEVITALSWLGQKSLEDFRLTAPAKDNAYYYYSKLLQIDPQNPRGQRGMLQIAERFALLAEREVANGNPTQAMQYVGIGLQIDPNNQALQSLQSLTGSSGGIGGLFK